MRLERMEQKARQIIKELKEKINQRYDLLEIGIFGSTARGDCTPGSDIDVFVNLPKINRAIEEDLFDLAYELELKYDCVIDLLIFGERNNFEIENDELPIYKNIIRDGIIL